MRGYERVPDFEARRAKNGRDPGAGLEGKFRTAREIAESTPVEVPWVVQPWAARGAITELDGKIKDAGKTTFMLHMIASKIAGKTFLGNPTEPGGVVFLTEQHDTSLVEALEDAGLMDEDRLLTLRYSDTIGTPWFEVVRVATQKALELGYGMLVVDTLGQFGGLTGDAENSSGAAMEVMRPLQEAAAKGLAVVFTRHERKGGGAVGESGRGSSAFGGAVDLIVLLRRAEGNVRNTVRKLETRGRFRETPETLMVEKTDHGYVSLGTETAVESNAARDRILRVAPAAEHEAKPKNVILDEAKVKYHTGHTVLSTLVNGGELRRKGEGKRGDPHRFWRPDPPGDDQQGTLSVARKESMYQQKENGGEKHSVGTPNRTDRKKASNGKKVSVDTSTSNATERKHDPSSPPDDDHPDDCICDSCLPI